MPVRIFFPRIPTDQEDFLKFVSGWCSTYNAKIAKNKDGSPFCILPINYMDGKVKSANDIIDALTGKVVGDITLKPRLYIEFGPSKELMDHRTLKEVHDDVVNITHYSRDFYYVQLLSEGDKNKQIGEYLKTLYEECRSNMLTLLEYDELTVGNIYASMYRNENHFYRVKLLEKLEGEEIKVIFIDYGNVEYLQEKPVLEINDKVASMAPLAHKCAIDNVCIVDAKKHDMLSREVLNRNYKAKIVRNVSDDGIESMSVDFIDFASVSYRKFLIFEGVAVESEPEIVNSSSKEYDTTRQSKTKSEAIKENGVEEMVESVVMTHIESLKEFYVQLVDKSVDGDVNEVNGKIESLIPNIRDDLQFVSDDILYLSQFTVDGNWYRCKVIDNKPGASGPCYLVQYIDFGNSETKYDPKDLKPLSTEWNDIAAQLATVDPCAIKCAFNDTLVTALKAARIGRKFFRQEYIATEKVAKLSYNDVGLGDKKMWLVSNLAADGEEDLLSKYVTEEPKEVVPSPDCHRLSNIESLARIWFQLVSTGDVDRDRDLKSIRKWSVGRIPIDVKSVTSVDLGQLYCAVNKHGQLFRCRVISRNMDSAMVQFIDTGMYDMVKTCLLYPLPTIVANITPIAMAYKLAISVKAGKEHEVEKRIVDILEQTDVKFDLVSENVVRDVFLREKSLRGCLSELGLVETGNGATGDKYDGLPDCLLPAVTEEADVDFSLPSVDQMNEVPVQVALENAKVETLRHLFHVNGGTCVLDEVFAIVDRCADLDVIIGCCDQVDDIEASLDSLRVDFATMLIDRKSKTRDLVPLLERRSVICDRICATHDRLRDLLTEMTGDVLESLLDCVQRSLAGVANLQSVLTDDNKEGTTDGDADRTDIATARASVAQFHASTVYRDSVLPTLTEYSLKTDSAKRDLERQVTAMCRKYDCSDRLPDKGSVTVSLVDCTYGLYSALQTEHSAMVALLANDDVLALFRGRSLLGQMHRYLDRQRLALVTIVQKTAKFESLHDYARDILADDSPVVQVIEDKHRKILSSRSALRHAVPDLEDAEELELKDRQTELQTKIRDIRQSLHRELRASADYIDNRIRALMLKKPELQLKNQSILLHEHGLPVFLWDPIYFDMSQESSSLSLDSSFVSSMFEQRPVKIKKVSLCLDEYRTVLGHLSAYSARQVPGQGQSGQVQVPVLEILYAFVSKCGNTVLYLVVPDFVPVALLPESLSLSDIVSLLTTVMEQVVNLWHLGLIYSDDDLRSGLLLRLKDNHDDDNDTTMATGSLCLPLPLASIVNRDNVAMGAPRSLNVYLRRLAALFDQALRVWEKKQSVATTKEVVKVDDCLRYLVCVISNCSEVAEAESVCEDLARYLTTCQDKDVADRDITDVTIIDEVLMEVVPVVSQPQTTAIEQLLITDDDDDEDEYADVE